MELSEFVNKSKKWMVIIVIWSLISFGTELPLISYIALLVAAIGILFFNDADALYILFGIVPFANIFKSSPNSQSFFTIIVFLYVGWNIIRKRYVHYLVIYIVLYSMYLLVVQIVCNTLDIKNTVKLAANLIFLHYGLENNRQIDDKTLFLSYISGIIASSVVKLSGLFPNINNYVATVVAGEVRFKDYVRFAGLYNDPNYYVVNVIIALCLIVVLFYRRKIAGIYALTLAGILVVLAGLTGSKSAILMLVLPGILFMYSNSKSRRHFLQVLFIAAVTLFVLLICAGKIKIFQTVFARLSLVDNIKSLTTGRTAIWQDYLRHFSNEGFTLFFGNGLGAGLVNDRGAHNTYIDLIYYLGIIGTVSIMSIIFAMTRTRYCTERKTPLNYSVILCILIMYTFLSELFYFDLVFQLYLSITVWGMPLENNRNLVMHCDWT